MTDKQFIQFSKEYFGDLDYTKLSEAEYKQLYEEKEVERISSLISSGKLDSILLNKFSLQSDGMTLSLQFNGKTISSTTLSSPYNPISNT